MKKKKIFLIVGRTASGKSMIARALSKERQLRQVKSYTTRPIRESEQAYPESADHYFISDDEVEKFKDQIAAYTEINGYKYFTTFDELDQCDTYVIDPNGIEDLKQRCGDKYNLITIYVRRPLKNTEQSYVARGSNSKEFKERYAAENEQFSAFEKATQWEYHIFNNTTIQDAINKALHIIDKEMAGSKDGENI